MGLSREQQDVVRSVYTNKDKEQIQTLGGYAGTGKCLPKDQVVQTFSGPKPIGEVQVGDKVVGLHGKEINVIGVYPQGTRQSYIITFSDGSTVESDLEHLWAVSTSKQKYKDLPPKVLTLQQIIEKGLKFKSGNFKYYIPLCGPVDYPFKTLDIHPYLLGALLGDGTNLGVTPTLCNPDFEVSKKCSSLLPDDMEMVEDKNSGCTRYKFVDKRKIGNRLAHIFKSFGLDLKSSDRFIPKEYLLSSTPQRMELLKGLMDTKGTSKGNRIVFSNYAEKLSYDLMNLVQSLGGTAIFRKPSAKGEFRINVKMFECPFYLSRKAVNWSFNYKNPPSRAIVDVSPSRVCEHVCIKVDSEDGLFLVGNYIVTHNTTIVRFLYDLFPSFAVCAFTGKATNVLRKKGMTASTIHSLIYKPVVEGNTVTFYLKDKYELPCTGFIIDESSMISKELYEDLVSFRLPIIFVGDHGQLEPVGSNINVMKNPMYKLETVHRNAGEIAYFAEHIRKGRHASTFESKDKVEFVDPKNVTDQLLIDVDQCICAFNKFRVAKNNQIRHALDRKNLVEVGDKIMCLRNNKVKLLFNGMQGIVTKIHPKYPRFDFESDGNNYADIMYDRNQWGKERNEFEFGKDSPDPFDYGYCITCHKCIHPDTFVETDQGLIPIKHIAPEGFINTIHGEKYYHKFIHNPPSESLKIRDEFGGEITVTRDHKVEFWDGNNFSIKLASQLNEGDFVRNKLHGLDFNNYEINIEVSKGSNAKYYELPNLMTENLAEFLGMFVTGGTLVDGKGFRFVKRNRDAVDRFCKLAFDIFGIEGNKFNVKNCYGREFCSSYIHDWLFLIGGLRPNKKDIPRLILKSNLKIQAAFLRGLFEDGLVSLKDSSIELHSCYPIILKTLKLMLARFGIHSKICWNYNRIYIYGIYCKLFKNKIGFVSEFKNHRLNEIKLIDRHGKVPISMDLLKKNKNKLGIYKYQNIMSRGYVSRNTARLLGFDLTHYYPRVHSIENTFCESMCVEVPIGHMFYQNGYNFGNSQGDEWPAVLVFEQECSAWDHVRWAYTAASRAKEKVYWVGKKKFTPVILKGMSNKKGSKMIPDWLK